MRSDDHADMLIVALDVHLEDDGVVHQAVDCQRGAGEDTIPLTEGLAGGDHHGAPLAAGGDELEEQVGLGLIPPHLRQVLEDQKIVPVGLGELGLQVEVLPRGLAPGQRCGRRAHASRFDQGPAASAAPRWLFPAEEQHIGAYGPEPEGRVTNSRRLHSTLG